MKGKNKELAFTRDKNQIGTPQFITEFMSDLVGIRGKRILDPTAGSGNLLTTAAEPFGIELEDRAFSILKQRFQEAAGAGHLVHGSVFEQSDFISSIHPDGVLMNPPFNADKVRGLSFIEFICNTVGKGPLVFLAPPKCGSNKPNAQREAKRRVLEKNTLTAVLDIGDVFEGAASVSVSLFIMEMGIPHHGETWFADISKIIKDTNASAGGKDWDAAREKILSDFRKMISRRRVNDDEETEDFYFPCGVSELSFEDEWSTRDHIEPAPFVIYREDFEDTARKYLEFKIQTYGIESVIENNKSPLTPENRIRSRRSEIERLKKQIQDIEQEIKQIEKNGCFPEERGKINGERRGQKK